MELLTPKRNISGISRCGSPPDPVLYPWNWGEEARNVNLSPGSSCSSPEYGGPGGGGGNHHGGGTVSDLSQRDNGLQHDDHLHQRGASSESHRRGRPRADALTNLMMQGSTSPSSIKCTYCNRVFPREKSLQAHLRTHTGERPYPCDYPGCTKAFTQSGQLKTHQRLHTGEKPFVCTAPGCEMRFTHANRHCPDHPYATLTRSDDFVLKPVSGNTEFTPDVTRWLERYKLAREREDHRTPTGKSDRKKKHWKSNGDSHKRIKSRKGLVMDSVVEQENLDRAPQTPSRLYCSESQDSQDESQDEDPTESCALLQNSEDEEATGIKLPLTPLRRPLDRLQPKKRWLSRASMEQQLAKPLRWDGQPTANYHRISDELHSSSQWCLSESTLPSLISEVVVKRNDLTPNKLDRLYVNSQLPSPVIDSDKKEKVKSLYIENETRPTVLMLAGKNQSPTSPQSPQSLTKISQKFCDEDVKVIVQKQENEILTELSDDADQKWLGALALMELARKKSQLNGDLDMYASPDYTHL